MATSSQTVDTTPTLVPSLTVGEVYAFQNTGNNRAVYVNQGTAIPDADTDDVHIIQPNEFVSVELVAGESAYVWTLIGSTRLAVSPSV